MAQAERLMLLVGQVRKPPDSTRERSRRYREKKRGGHGFVSPPAPARVDVAEVVSPGARSPFPVHPTRHLESIGAGPEAYLRIPPGVDAPAAAPAPPTADQEAGARKVAMVVAGLFKLATDDAAVRFELGERLGVAGVKGDDLERTLAAAVVHVHESTMRACLKHGIGITLPYEDELTAVGAAVLSGAYLAAKYTGRLDELAGKRQGVEVGPGRRQPSKRSGPVDDGPEADELSNPYGTVRMPGAA